MTKAEKTGVHAVAERAYDDMLAKAEALVSAIAKFSTERERMIETTPDHQRTHFLHGGDPQAQLISEVIGDALSKWVERQHAYNARRAEHAAGAA